MILNKEDIRKLFPAAERAAQETAALIHSKLPPGYGFALVVFSFGKGGFTTYVSNANRADMTVALQELIDNVKANLDAPPGTIGQKD